MRILSISLKNIKSHRERELHFVKGINVLSGVNGAGKSTVFEAIGYGLFGVDARDFVGNIDRFITIGEKKGEVSVTFETSNGEIFRASRTVGSGSKWLLARQLGNDFEIEDHAGAPETEARIKALLGLESGRSLADQFKLVIGPFQNEFLGPFVLKQPTKRQEAFDEILGIDAWRKTFKNTSTLQAAVKSKIEVLTVEIAGKEEQTATLPEREQELAGLIQQTEKRQKEFREKEEKRVETDNQLALLDQQEKMITRGKGEIQVLENRISDGKGKIDEQKNRVVEAEKALKALENHRKGKEAYDAAETRLTSLRELDTKRRSAEKEISSLEKECSRLAQALAHESLETDKTARQLAEEEKRIRLGLQTLCADAAVTRLAAGLPELRAEIEKLRTARGLLEGRRAGLQEGQQKLAEGICPFFREPCLNIAGKTPRDVFSARVEELDTESLALGRRIDVLHTNIAPAEKAKQELEAMQVREQELTKQLQTLADRSEQNNRRREKLDVLRAQQNEADQKAAARKADLKQYGDLDKEIAGVEKQRLEHQTSRDVFVANQKDALDLENRLQSLRKMEGLYTELQQVLGVKKGEIEQLQKEYDPVQHQEIRKVKEQLVAASATLRQQLDSLNKDRDRIGAEIKNLNRLKEEVRERQAQRKTLEETDRLVKFLRNKIFNNVSVQLSERFREEISLRADIIYRRIAETDEELHWGDKYQIILRDMLDGKLRERSDDQLSGGQVMSAVVALRLALLQTIGARIAFFDEPTSNLDAVRRENLAHAFRAIDVGREEVTEHWYDQLFLISHDVAFTEVTDQIVTLE